MSGVGLGVLFGELDHTSNTDVLKLHTANFLRTLRAVNPRFAEMQGGMPAQQVGVIFTGRIYVLKQVLMNRRMLVNAGGSSLPPLK